MYLKDSRHLRHHAFVIEAGREEGIKLALEWARQELGMVTKANLDIVTFQYGLLTVEGARRVNENAMQAPITGDTKIIIIAASRAYHEAQNALLKLFEEPPVGTIIFLVIPSVGMLLPTLKSRVQILRDQTTMIYHSGTQGHAKPNLSISKTAEEFLRANKEKRSVMIKKLANGKDEEDRRENRDVAIAIVSGVEAIAYASGVTGNLELLRDIQTLRGYLHDRSAPVRMILEHLSLVIPRDLV